MAILYCMQLISQRVFCKSYIVNFCGNFTQLIFNCFNNGYTLSLESTIYAAGDSSYSVLASYAVKCFVQRMNANHLQAWLRKFHVVVFDYLYVIVILWFTMHFNWIYSACFTIQDLHCPHLWNLCSKFCACSRCFTSLCVQVQ